MELIFILGTHSQRNRQNPNSIRIPETKTHFYYVVEINSNPVENVIILSKVVIIFPSILRHKKHRICATL